MKVTRVDTEARAVYIDDDRTLRSTHTEYWKTIRRGGDGLDGHTVGFEWFAPWPTSRRLRFPIGRRERLADILGWTVTSQQVKRGELVQEAKLASDDRNGCEVIDPKDSTRRTWHPGRPYDRMGVTVLLGLMRRQTTRMNKRQGWRPDGSEVTA